MKIDYSEFYPLLETTPLAPWIDLLPQRIAAGLSHERHGMLYQWEETLAGLPTLETASIDLNNEVRVEGESHPQLELSLRTLHPWRKGPYHIHGIDIETEWRSDWKWDRVKPHLQPLSGRTILDVGCGNGYHCWRMAGAGAKLVIGVDPSPLFTSQFFAVKKYIKHSSPWVLPLGIEDVPTAPETFDTVFSMGVLYHRKSPIDHLLNLKDYLRPGGEIVMETLVIDGPEGHSLVPKGRYGKMRNVWFIPSVKTLELWMLRCGFKEIRTVDVTTTTTDEQRSTDWMTFESLTDFLNPANMTRTIEGYPAPKRAVILASV